MKPISNEFNLFQARKQQTFETDYLIAYSCVQINRNKID